MWNLSRSVRSGRLIGKGAALVMAFVMLSLFAVMVQPALAFDPGDDRYDPDISDRLAVYVRDGGVEVWGIEGNGDGMYLTTFSAAELASGKTLVAKTEHGTVTLMETALPVIAGVYDENGALTGYEVTESAEYVVSWVDANSGADGSWPFSKAFAATYIAE